MPFPCLPWSEKPTLFTTDHTSSRKTLYALKNALNHLPTVAKVPHKRRISAAFPPHFRRNGSGAFAAVLRRYCGGIAALRRSFGVPAKPHHAHAVHLRHNQRRTNKLQKTPYTPKYSAYRSSRCHISVTFASHSHHISVAFHVTRM